jgi:hypothetical protein
MVDRKMVKAGDFLTSGPPAVGQSLTKVFAVKSVEDIEAADREFDRVSKLTQAIEQTRKAIEALKSKPN